MTYTEIEAMQCPELQSHLAGLLFDWKYATVEGSGYQRQAVGNVEQGTGVRTKCPDWTLTAAWLVVDQLRLKGFRVNMAEVAPNVGEVVVVEYSAKHPKQDRVEVTCYYGLRHGMDSCAVALCRAALMAVTTFRLKEGSP